MGLTEEFVKAQKEISADGYEMSFGEIINLYRDEELVINPNYQRLFRWDIKRQSRFIESILLSIPVPPIFVFQGDDGVWELIDGLQRISTILKFTGYLKDESGQVVEPSVLTKTNFLPSLEGKQWKPSPLYPDDGIGAALQLQIKRARLRVEILRRESDVNIKYEVFQRLNTGGAILEEQEVRNCTGYMLNPEFQDWIISLSENEDFRITTDQTKNALEKQYGVELVLRFLSFRLFQYRSSLDVHEYLDESLRFLASSDNFNYKGEAFVFDQTFSMLNRALGKDAFKKWNGIKFSGKFLMSVYEVVVSGVSKNLETLLTLSEEEQNQFVRAKAKSLWEDRVFQKNSGAGVRGTTRLLNLLPMAKDFFKYEN